MDYLNKLILLDREKSEKLVRHAFVEQRHLELTWFSTVKKIASVPATNNSIKPPNTLLCSKRGHIVILMEKWDRACQQNKKLVFYNTIKTQFGVEPYIEKCWHVESKLVAKWRMSAHKLNRETGRYGLKAGSVHYKCCETCTDPESLALLTNLPGEWDPILEDEIHVMVSCPRYNNIREKLNDNSKHVLQTDVASLFSADKIKECNIFIKKLNNERFRQKNES